MAPACLARRLAPAAVAASRTAMRRLPLLCRATATKAANTAKPVEVYTFLRAPDEAPIFPELMEPGRRAVLLAVDPDLGGAVAALTWVNPPAVGAAAAAASDGGGGTATGGEVAAPQQQGQLVLPPLDQICFEVHDMPVEIWKYGSRDKRQPEASGLINILQRYVDAATGGGVLWDNLGVTSSNASTTSGSSSRSGDAADAPADAASKPKRRRKKSKAAADCEPDGAEASIADATHAAAAANMQPSNGAETVLSTAASQGSQEPGSQPAAALAAAGEPPVLRAVIEYTMPPHACGKFAWFGIGFAVGLLNGLFTSQRIPFHRVPASTWKRAMGLNKQGKDVSIALASNLLPAASGSLKRKKDHGRAEALLMAAWGLGIRMQPTTSSIDSADDCTDGSADEDGVAAGALEVMHEIESVILKQVHV